MVVPANFTRNTDSVLENDFWCELFSVAIGKFQNEIHIHYLHFDLLFLFGSY